MPFTKNFLFYFAFQKFHFNFVLEWRVHIANKFFDILKTSFFVNIFILTFSKYIMTYYKSTCGKIF